MSGIRVITAFDGQDAGVVLSAMEPYVYGKKYPLLDKPSVLDWDKDRETKGEYFLRTVDISEETRKNLEVSDSAEKENHVKSKPFGYWDTEFTQSGIRYKLDMHETLVKIKETPFNKNLVAKMTYHGVSHSEPSYIYKIILIVKYPHGKKEREFLEQTRDLCKWLILNDNVDVHIINYGDIINSQEVVTKHLQTILGVGGVFFLDDLPEDKPSPDNVIERVCQCLRTKNFEEAYEVCFSELEQRNRAQRSWKCHRTDKKTTEEQCKLCVGNKEFRETLKKRAVNSNVDWMHKPCLFECGKDIDGDPITFETSIKNNFWV
jgi:hypothetical protein